MAYSATTYHAATREAVNLATLIVRMARILATSLFGFAALATVTTRAADWHEITKVNAPTVREFGGDHANLNAITASTDERVLIAVRDAGAA
jgi:hypothetical protein